MVTVLGVPSESRAGETRVAATPKTVEQLRGLGYEVVVESGAGARASFADAAYEEAGARVASQDEVWASDLVLKINAPSDEEIARLRDGAILASLVSPAIDPDLVAKLAARRITVLAMDAVPRISRAQSLDVLSSMANIAGYRAVIEAAHEFGSLFTGQVTAAGKVPPAKVLVVGAGVAGTRRDRHGGQPRRGGARLRRPPGGRRAGRVDGRGVPAGRPVRGGVAGQRGRVRHGRRPRTSTARPPSCMRRRPPTSTSSSPPR